MVKPDKQNCSYNGSICPIDNPVGRMPYSRILFEHFKWQMLKKDIENNYTWHIMALKWANNNMEDTMTKDLLKNE